MADLHQATLSNGFHAMRSITQFLFQTPINIVITYMVPSQVVCSTLMGGYSKCQTT